MRTELDPDQLALTVFGLYKLKEGWRITNVVWGRVTNDQ